MALGMKCGSAAKSSLVRTSMSEGPWGHADQARELVCGYGVKRRHNAPSKRTGAILQLSPHGEIAPHG
jgi:hypothetical protein